MLGQCFVTLKLVKRLQKTAKSLIIKKYQWMFCDTETDQKLEKTESCSKEALSMFCDAETSQKT